MNRHMAFKPDAKHKLVVDKWFRRDGICYKKKRNND